MSFSQEIKKEIVSNQLTADCCITAACYGVALFGRYFGAKGVALHTEQAYIAQWVKSLYTQAGISGKVFVRGESAKTYEFSVQDVFETEKMLAMFSHSGDEPALRLKTENISCSGCFSAFVGAAFLCCGTVPNPEGGYMMEFVSPRYRLMHDFEQLFSSHNFSPKLTRRKGANVVYFKASEQIEDLLTTMGAPKAALEIMNMKVYKDFRNRANRITNCETANIDKIVNANRQTLEAIQKLERSGILQTLPQPLQQAAILRKQNPDLSLAELVEHSPEPVSKSGLSHRYKKIREKAENI